MFIHLLKAGKSEFHTETGTVMITYTQKHIVRFSSGQEKCPENHRFLVYKKPNANNFTVKCGQSTKSKQRIFHLCGYVYYILTGQPEVYFSPWKKQVEKFISCIITKMVHIAQLHSYLIKCFICCLPLIFINLKKTTK